MPNWCEVDLTIVGPTADIKRFARENKGKKEYKDDTPYLAFGKAIPQPDEGTMIKEVLANPRGGVNFTAKTAKELKLMGAWWYWRIMKWGTKWNPKCHSMSDIQTVPRKKGISQVEYCMDTAWSPPIPWLIVVAEKYPTLKFQLKYYEAGMGFCGTYTIKGTHTYTDSHRDNYRGK